MEDRKNIRNQQQQTHKKYRYKQVYDIPSGYLPLKLAPSSPMVSITMQSKQECSSILTISSMEQMHQILSKESNKQH